MPLGLIWAALFPAPVQPVAAADLLAETHRLAALSLRSNYRRIGQGAEARTYLVSGPGAYEHVHGRDFSMAAGGALALGDTEVVRDTLETFLSFQRADGLLPRALAPWPPYVMIALDTVGFHLPFRGPLRPNYRSEWFVVNVDCNALLVWTAARYVRASGDAAFASRHYPALVRAMGWYSGRLKEGLVNQPPYSDWQDTIARGGRVFYSNLTYWKGLESMAELAAALGRGDEAQRWRADAAAFREKAQSFFWDESKGLYRNSESLPQTDVSANLLAVAWGFAEPEASEKILKALDGPDFQGRFGPRTTVPDYPLHRKTFITLIAGVPDYHDRQVWSWIAAAAALAHARLGRRERAARVLEAMAKEAARVGELGEVYDDAGPVRRRLYRSASPFSWGAGMWLEALAASRQPP